MKKFSVSAIGTEVLAEEVIEAASEEEAREKYFDLWCKGMIQARDYELEGNYSGTLKRLKSRSGLGLCITA